jgi:hypothetical protein
VQVGWPLTVGSISLEEGALHKRMPLEWKEIGWVRVRADGDGGFWTLAEEFVPGTRLLRVRVSSRDPNGQAVPTSWSQANGVPCGPDGDPAITAPTGILCSAAACGALIGKIGGSTADIPDTAGGSAGPYAGKKVFAVGHDCIVSLPAAGDGGPLFLTMNDKPQGFVAHTGELLVFLQYYPLQ